MYALTWGYILTNKGILLSTRVSQFVLVVRKTKNDYALGFVFIPQCLTKYSTQYIGQKQ